MERGMRVNANSLSPLHSVERGNEGVRIMEDNFGGTKY
jgi:hypothetical protein